MLATCLAHPVLLHLINSSLCSFLQSPDNCFLIGPHIFPAPTPDVLVRDQVRHPHQTRGRIGCCMYHNVAGGKTQPDRAPNVMHPSANSHKICLLPKSCQTVRIADEVLQHNILYLSTLTCCAASARTVLLHGGFMSLSKMWTYLYLHVRYLYLHVRYLYLHVRYLYLHVRYPSLHVRYLYLHVRYPSLHVRYLSLHVRYPSLHVRYLYLHVRYPSLHVRYPSLHVRYLYLHVRYLYLHVRYRYLHVRYLYLHVRYLSLH